ncbi:hypothetical protein B0H11DRAFT_2213791 [Mycena galericulata]|nr:hypothetical protein B0H11DRAFT_2213791 [Mycena galericulata]
MQRPPSSFIHRTTSRESANSSRFPPPAARHAPALQFFPSLVGYGAGTLQTRPTCSTPKPAAVAVGTAISPLAPDIALISRQSHSATSSCYSRFLLPSSRAHVARSASSSASPIVPSLMARVHLSLHKHKHLLPPCLRFPVDPRIPLGATDPHSSASSSRLPRPFLIFAFLALAEGRRERCDGKLGGGRIRARGERKREGHASSGRDEGKEDGSEDSGGRDEGAEREGEEGHDHERRMPEEWKGKTGSGSGSGTKMRKAEGTTYSEWESHSLSPPLYPFLLPRLLPAVLGACVLLTTSLSSCPNRVGLSGRNSGSHSQLFSPSPAPPRRAPQRRPSYRRLRPPPYSPTWPPIHPPPRPHSSPVPSAPVLVPPHLRPHPCTRVNRGENRARSVLDVDPAIDGDIGVDESPSVNVDVGVDVHADVEVNVDGLGLRGSMAAEAGGSWGQYLTSENGEAYLAFTSSLSDPYPSSPSTAYQDPSSSSSPLHFSPPFVRRLRIRALYIPTPVPRHPQSISGLELAGGGGADARSLGMMARQEGGVQHVLALALTASDSRVARQRLVNSAPPHVLRARLAAGIRISFPVLPCSTRVTWAARTHGGEVTATGDVPMPTLDTAVGVGVGVGVDRSSIRAPASSHPSTLLPAHPLVLRAPHLPVFPSFSDPRPVVHALYARRTRPGSGSRPCRRRGRDRLHTVMLYAS